MAESPKTSRKCLAEEAPLVRIVAGKSLWDVSLDGAGVTSLRMVLQRADAAYPQLATDVLTLMEHPPPY